MQLQERQKWTRKDEDFRIGYLRCNHVLHARAPKYYFLYGGGPICEAFPWYQDIPNVNRFSTEFNDYIVVITVHLKN